MERRPPAILAAAARRLAPLGRRVQPLVAAGARWLFDQLGDQRERVGRRWQARESRRHAELRRRSVVPLPNLFDVHPEARTLARRELGLRTVGLDEIAGTAVAGATQRGSDFTPLKEFRTTNWQYRFQAIRRAMERMSILPPIDVMRYGGRYWVEDGHNRVAAALYGGQAAIDASVTELRAPGAPSTEAPGSLAPMLEAGRDLRAAGSGRFTRTVPELITEEDLDTATAERARGAAGGLGPVGREDARSRAADAQPGDDASGRPVATSMRRPVTDVDAGSGSGSPASDERPEADSTGTEGRPIDGEDGDARATDERAEDAEASADSATTEARPAEGEDVPAVPPAS